MSGIYIPGVTVPEDNTMWIAERDACDGCKTCEYFLHEYWNCQGDQEICPEYLANFIPADKEGEG